MIVISSALQLAAVSSDPSAPNANNPLVGYQNRTTVTNVTADTEEAAWPAINLANPSTYLKWQGEESEDEQHITVVLGTVDLVDYVGVAKHNFGSAQIIVSVEGSADGEYWFELVQPTLQADDSPIIFQFEPQSLHSIRLKMEPGLEAPRTAIFYVGLLLQLPRRLYVGHRPMNFNRGTNIVTGRSESGNFLGRIVLSEAMSTTISMKNVPPLTYRTDIEPWLVAAVTTPFFFAWRPSTYNREVGFGWAMDDSTMSNSLPNGLVEFALNMQGIVS